MHCAGFADLRGVNLGIEGIFEFDPLTQILGAQSALARAVRIVIGLASPYGIYLVIQF